MTVSRKAYMPQEAEISYILEIELKSFVEKKIYPPHPISSYSRCWSKAKFPSKLTCNKREKRKIKLHTSKSKTRGNVI